MEEERVKEEIARWLYEGDTSAGLSDNEWVQWKTDHLRGYTYKLELADQILSIKGIRIESDDQGLPSVRNAVNKSYNDYMLGQEDMLKAGFVKCKRREDGS